MCARLYIRVAKHVKVHAGQVHAGLFLAGLLGTI